MKAENLYESHVSPYTRHSVYLFINFKSGGTVTPNSIICHNFFFQFTLLLPDFTRLWGIGMLGEQKACKFRKKTSKRINLTGSDFIG